MTQPIAVSPQHSANDFSNEIRDDGFAIVANVLQEGDLAKLRCLFRFSSHSERNLLGIPDIRALAVSETVRSLVEPILGDACFAVRALLFDKTADTNWNVAWHQDRVIAVRARKESVGFQAWTMKAAVAHVQPPAEVVERMLAVRLHLDECGENNGALQVIPASHRNGFIGETSLEEWKKQKSMTCSVAAGDAILMRPLLLHSSSRNASPHRRRVVHIEFSSSDLPGGLEWHTRVA